MARQSGHQPLRGSIGNITYFRHPFYGDAARERYGPSKERIETDPAYASVKENNNTMAFISKNCKLIREGFKPINKHIADSKVSWRLVGVGWEIYEQAKELKCDNAFESEAMNLLRGFCFSTDGLKQILIHPKPVISKEGNTVTVIVNSAMQSIIGCTHYRITSCLCGYDFTNKLYSPDVCDSDIQEAEAVRDFDFIHELNVQMPVHIITVSVMCYQNVNGKFYRLENKECKVAEIVEVLVRV